MTAGARLQRFIRHMLVRRAGVCLLPSPSFQRKLESSGLDHPFPHSGNDNHRDNHPTRHSVKPAIPSPPASPPGFLGGLSPTCLPQAGESSRASMQAWIPACAGMTMEEPGRSRQSSAAPLAASGRDHRQTGKKNRPRGAVWIRLVTGGSGQYGFADQVLDIVGVGLAQFGDLLRVFHGRL